MAVIEKVPFKGIFLIRGIDADELMAIVDNLIEQGFSEDKDTGLIVGEALFEVEYLSYNTGTIVQGVEALSLFLLSQIENRTR